MYSYQKYIFAIYIPSFGIYTCIPVIYIHCARAFTLHGWYNICGQHLKFVNAVADNA